MMVCFIHKFLMERLFFFEAANKDLEELFESGDCKVFAAVIINRHLLYFCVLLNKQFLLCFELCLFPFIICTRSPILVGAGRLILKKVFAILAEVFCEPERIPGLHA